MASWSEPRKKKPQAERILEYLQLGGWWKTSALLHYVPCIVHSRISDLRARGYRIEHRTTGPGADGSEYRLATVDETGGPLAGGAGAASPVSSTAALDADASPSPQERIPPVGASASSATAPLDLNQLSLLEVA